MSWAQNLKMMKGNKVGAAIEELHRSENHLAGELISVSDQQKVDHEVFYLARDLARWSQEHVRDLARIGKDYGLDLDADPEDESSLLARMKQKGSELAAGRHHNASVLLIADLRRIHRMAAGVSLDWEILAQTAQAMKDTELLGLTKKCHPDTLRQLRWANAKLKESSAQIMVTG